MNESGLDTMSPEEHDAQACHAEARTLYWKAKDLRGARRCLEAGIALAIGEGRPELAQPMLYDLASFCWCGWDEAEIEIGEEELALGEWAAAENLRLTEGLGLGPYAEANAWFLIGAYNLARDRRIPARAAFALMEERSFGHPELTWLARGFTAIAKENVEAVLAAVTRLSELGGDGRLFADELRTAAALFNRSEPSVVLAAA